MTILALSYLGRHVDELLKALPFSRWQVVRTIQSEPKKEVWYEFEGRGVDVICDESNRVQTVFIRRGDGESLIEIPFAVGRSSILAKFGSPSKSGGKVRIPGVGERGPWDRFTLPMGTIHVQYSVDGDEIDMISLIRADVLP
jgi:hypothetical protein